ncbi:MAG: hypothetical protein R3220_12135 [Balneolaceae bacterium]|nr:hypothetical protein [Balneolaceae bacterium]
MITLHRHKTDTRAEEIEEKFQDLVLAYRVETLPEDESGPFIIDGDQKIEGEKEIVSWLRGLEGDLQWQRSITGDGCYIDPRSGEVC